MGVDLKNLKELIALCRKTGVQELSVDGISLKLKSDAPPSNYKRKLKSVSKEEISPEFSEDELLFWSAGQVPMDGAS